MKPYDGGGWAGVSRVDDEDALRRSYDESGTYLLHLQRRSSRTTSFVRCIGLGPQTRLVRYDPGRRCTTATRWTTAAWKAEEREVLLDTTLTINAFFGWDFNSCEALRQHGTWHPIDFANPCPDSQVTSLHYHFPWLVKANLRWSIFCAVTKRPMPENLDWEPFFEIADADRPMREKLRGVRGHRPRRASRPTSSRRSAPSTWPTSTRCVWEFFGTEIARDAVRQKVGALFPAHEVEQFTELFWERIQRWRDDNAPVDR